MLWFNLYDNAAYKSDDNAFIVPAEIKGIKELELSYELVYAELNKYLEAHEFKSHFNTTMVDKPKTWRVRSLRVWGVEMYGVQKYFPETMNLLNNIPHVVNIGFNLLQPHSNIKPHGGDTNAIVRCHLGLKIPKDENLCAIKVNGFLKHWQQGKVIGFEDAFEHEAWNHSDETRIIMLFDVLKPQFIKDKRKICATIISSLYLQRFGNIFPKLYSVKRKKFRLLNIPFVYILKILIPLRNFIKK